MIYDICTRKSYTKNGEEKVLWLKCGTVNKTNEGKMFITMNAQPETTFYVFEQKRKDTAEPKGEWE